MHRNHTDWRVASRKWNACSVDCSINSMYLFFASVLSAGSHTSARRLLEKKMEEMEEEEEAEEGGR